MSFHARILARALAAMFCGLGFLCARDAVVAAAPLEFNRDIRPILSDRCFKCHGPDKASRKAGLRLDVPEGAYAEREKSHEHAVVPGKPQESLLCKKIFAADPADAMPPPNSNLTLNAQEKERLRRWIAEGSKYQPHWAFVPLPEKVAVPTVKNKHWARNEIDDFILARLESEGLKPSKEADKLRWLRRVSYDLTGLPPTPEEAKAFLANPSPGAYEKVVDRLLTSPHFGQRLAVPWLDAARYADSYGYQSDQLCPTWPYRDWVVAAFNRNLPYSQFILDQLAGDLIAGADESTRLATAFNRLHRQTNEGGSIEEEWRLEYVSDRIATFSTAFLGLTFECTHCHDHKFDPLTQKDYYSLGAFFNSIDEYGLYNDTDHVPTPSMLLPTAEQKKAIITTVGALQEKKANLARAASEAEPAFQQWLAGTNLAAEIPGLAAWFKLDAVTTNNTFANAVNAANFSGGLGGNKLAPGKSGHAVQFDGDDELSFPGTGGNFSAWTPYTAVFWLYLPKSLTNAIICHRESGTDAGFHGIELSLDEGRLMFVIKRFWPGNALAVRSLETVPSEEWVQIGMSYDGSATAEGMTLFINGRQPATEIVRNHLYKSPGDGGDGLSFGALFRATGLKDGRLDDVRLYTRALAPLEVQQLFDGHALADALAARDATRLRPYYLAAVSPAVSKARAERREAVKNYFQARDGVEEVSVMEELPKPRPAYILARGRYDAPKTEDRRVGRATPAVLPPFPAGSPKDRLGLAQWLLEPNHPLTARVAVNRFWQMLFGRGIVATTENFGVQGAPPSHPELLDWLARDFVQSNWDVKALLKKIVLSATYRQDSKWRPDLREKDPENILLARGPSQRLPAEMVRDTALAASGLLDDALGGPPVSPYSPGDLWRESNDMSPAYHQSVGAALYRRSLYTVWKRTAPMPDMTEFDAPSREVCVVKRSATSTPQQAFVLLNDTQFVEAARVLAEKAMHEGGTNLQQRIAFAFWRLTARPPEPKELETLAALWQEQRDIFTKEPDRARQLIAVGDHARDANLDAGDLAATTIVAQAIMNLDATVWKR
jgi:hypothetical protein